MLNYVYRHLNPNIYEIKVLPKGIRKSIKIEEMKRFWKVQIYVLVWFFIIVIDLHMDKTLQRCHFAKKFTRVTFVLKNKNTCSFNVKCYYRNYPVYSIWGIMHRGNGKLVMVIENRENEEIDFKKYLILYHLKIAKQ